MANIRVDQTEWAERNNAYLERHRKAMERVDELEAAKRERLGKGKIIEGFIKDIENRPLAIDEFDEKLWLAVTAGERRMKYIIFGIKKERTNLYCSFAQNAYFVVCEGSSPVSIGKRLFGIYKNIFKKSTRKMRKTPIESEFFVRHLYCYLPK